VGSNAYCVGEGLRVNGFVGLNTVNNITFIKHTQQTTHIYNIHLQELSTTRMYLLGLEQLQGEVPLVGLAVVAAQINRAYEWVSYIV
jgi:hypothetical protein